MVKSKQPNSCMVKSKPTKFVYGYEQTDQIRVWLRANRPISCMVKSKQTKLVYG